MQPWPIVDPKNRNKLLSLQTYQLDFATSESFSTLMAGGWGSGKTTAGLGFLAMSAMLNPPGSQGAVILPTIPMVKEYLETTLLPAFSKVMVRHDLGRKAIYLPDNRRLYYRSGHIPERIQMSNLSYVYLDEPHLMSETLFLNAQARAREAGSQLRIGLASLPKIGWLSREFQGRNGEHRRVIHASTEQNKFNHPDYIANMKRACPARMQACYLQGQFIPDGDAVYPEFNRDIHVIPWKYTPEIRNAKDQWTSTEIGYVFDWSPRRPHVLWCQHVPPPVKMPGGWITNKEITVVVDEIYPDGKYTGGVPTVKLCHMAKSRKPRSSSRNYPCMWAVCDPAGKAVQSTSGESDIIQAERILGVNMLYLFGQRIRIGIQHVKLALEPLEGHPTLFFSDDLIKYAVEPKERSVIRSMEGYSYAAQKGSILDDDPDHDDIFSHACDDIRYHQTYFFAEDRLNSEIWSAQ